MDGVFLLVVEVVQGPFAPLQVDLHHFILFVKDHFLHRTGTGEVIVASLDAVDDDDAQQHHEEADGQDDHCCDVLLEAEEIIMSELMGFREACRGLSFLQWTLSGWRRHGREEGV